MESLDLISKLLNERIMLGKKEDLTENLSIVPVYKVKVNFFNVNTDIKNTTGDGSSGSLLITPVCILQIKNETVTILKFEDKTPKEDFFDVIPSLMSNININDVLKGLKI
ncbi:MAG: hypothetical protein NC087_06375 [Anaeroplasma bactoclasticum]|nr:hypothetical protein [Anaeroplasma bactoclasticum]